MIGVLGISHKDAQSAILWMRWAVKLSERSDDSQHKLIVVYTQRVSSGHRRHIEDIAATTPTFFSTQFITLGELQENGYPGSASHLFVSSMTLAGSMYPLEPILWLEADAIPTRPGWFATIAEEYSTCEKPFMGHLESEHDIKHMAGVGVYPPNWKELSPMLATSHSAPDIDFWGKWKGQAFDAYAAPEVYPQAQQARTIQQVFGKRRWIPSDLRNLRPEAVLVHQSKDGSLISLLTKYPRDGHENTSHWTG